jgi:acetyl esterase/lipase
MIRGNRVHPATPAAVRRILAVVAMGALLTGCWAPTLSTGATTYTVSVTTGIVYGQGAVDGGADTKDLLLDLYTPQGTGRAVLPLVLVVHGGGFVGGSRSQSNVVRWSNEFASRGYLVASIDYRLMGDDPLPSERVAAVYDQVINSGGDAQQVAAVAAIDDTLTALDHLLARSDVDENSTTLVGGSAGAVTVDNVAYLLDDFGVRRPPIRAVISNWGGLPVGAAETWIQNPLPTSADPYFEPPVFLAHATGDPTVPYQLSVDIAQRAQEVGLRHHLYTRAGNAHGFDLASEPYGDGRSVLDAQVDFVTCTIYGATSSDPACSWN